ncbi:MAG: metal ABC transporter solute-binding protein, Zn/Mn family, partial [Sciscionella sp.]
GLEAVCTEPVADYLLRTAGIQVATPREFAEAVEHDIDVPAEALARTTSLISGKKVDILVNNVQTQTPTTNQLEAVAGRAGVPVVDVTETQPAGSTGYLSWMGKTVERLTAAADGQR